MDNKAFFKLSYGLFVLSAREGEKDNGCIINTAMQVTDHPKQLAVAINKNNYTHDMILHTGQFNLSVLTEKVPFAVFEQFGFQSGRDAEKFREPVRTPNGIAYLEEYTNAVLCGKVVQSIDCGTHTLFITEVEQAMVLNEEPSVTYAYYFEHIKPKPKAEGEKKKFVCEICGFVYEGEELPEDYVCPLCKHGAAFFKEI
ncbi:MAG: flavin reductase [Clostridia bacterium]|nr:flavin reductase [Clostridia bacterium]